MCFAVERMAFPSPNGHSRRQDKLENGDHVIDRRLFLLAGVGLLAGAGFVAVAPWSQGLASEAIFTGKTNGVAINGYDPVGYFKQNAPVEGSDEFTADYEGVKWQFASAENRDLFVSNPEKYAPQYGGYCAYAAANNSLAKTEPEAFTIADGKLYLNYDLQIRSRWEGDQSANISKADKYWPDLKPK